MTNPAKRLTGRWLHVTGNVPWLTASMNRHRRGGRRERTSRSGTTWPNLHSHLPPRRSCRRTDTSPPSCHRPSHLSRTRTSTRGATPSSSLRSSSSSVFSCCSSAVDPPSKTRARTPARTLPPLPRGARWRTTSFDKRGSAPGLVDTRGGWFSGRVCGRVDLLKLDRGVLAEAALPAASVGAGLDPDHDRQPQFLSGVPPLGVEDVLL